MAFPIFALLSRLKAWMKEQPYSARLTTPLSRWPRIQRGNGAVRRQFWRFPAAGLLGSLLAVVIVDDAWVRSQPTKAYASSASTAVVYSLPGSPSECYLLDGTSGTVIRDSCGHEDGTIPGDKYSLSKQGVTWTAGGSQITTRVTSVPTSVLACFTHEFGGTRFPGDVTLFEKYPSLLTAEGVNDNSFFLEGQDGGKQGRNVANLGFLYFTEARSPNQYLAATSDGTNGGPHCLVLNRVSSGGDQFYLDGRRMAMAYDVSTGAGHLGDGHLVIGGRLADPDYWFHGTLHLLVLWNAETLTTQATVNQAMAWANYQLQKKGLPAAGEVPAHANDLQSRFVIVGDSITACEGRTIVTRQQCWSLNIHLQNPAVVTVPVALGGLSGQFDAITSPWREGTLFDPNAAFNVAQFYFGPNDGCRNQFSEEELWQRAVQWSRSMRRLGVRTLFTTMIDIVNPRGCGRTNESGTAFKNNLNAIARSNYRGVFDGIIDLASYPGLGADGSNQRSCFGPDHTHPNATCQGKIIEMVEDSANYVLNSGPTIVTAFDYTMKASDKEVIVLPTATGRSAVTLPSCLGKTGMRYTVSNSSSSSTTHTLTVKPILGESILGTVDQGFSIAPGRSVTLEPIVVNPSVAGCVWATA
jgi:hypothetical protein